MKGILGTWIQIEIILISCYYNYNDNTWQFTYRAAGPLLQNNTSQIELQLCKCIHRPNGHHFSISSHIKVAADYSHYETATAPLHSPRRASLSRRLKDSTVGYKRTKKLINKVLN